MSHAGFIALDQLTVWAVFYQLPEHAAWRCFVWLIAHHHLAGDDYFVFCPVPVEVCR
jgi:hypothetical protein